MSRAKIVVVTLITVALVVFAVVALRVWAGLSAEDPLWIGAEDDGRVIPLRGGENLIVVLDSGPTAEHRWQLQESNQAVLRQVGHVYKSRGRPWRDKARHGGQEIWYFEARSPGRTVLQLEYPCLWDVDAEPTMTFAVQVTVTPASAILLALQRWGVWTPTEPYVVMEYQRSGGFSGATKQWLIYNDGFVVGRDLRTGESVTGEVGARNVAKLLRLIRKGGFSDDRYLPQGSCRDCFTYRITVFENGKGRSIAVTDGADAPEELWRIIERLNALSLNAYP